MNNFEMILFEYGKAVEKHPVFCSDMTTQDFGSIVKPSLEIARILKKRTKTAEAVLCEEILEAMDAYCDGRLDNCLSELAQCGAVILRMMEFVREQGGAL